MLLEILLVHSKFTNPVGFVFPVGTIFQRVKITELFTVLVMILEALIIQMDDYIDAGEFSFNTRDKAPAASDFTFPVDQPA